MTYSPSKPDPGPSPKLDASQIKSDFSVWGTVFAINHIGMNIFNQGDHTQVVMEKITEPNTITQDLAILLNKDAPSAATGGIKPQLFVKVPPFLPTIQDTMKLPNPTSMQLTYGTVNTAGPQYQSFLPGGYVIYWGSTATLGTITLSPVPTKILAAYATVTKLFNTGGIQGLIPVQVSTHIVTASTFTISSSSVANPFVIYWFAIAQQ